MKAIPKNSIKEFLSKNRIKMANDSLRIGRELTYQKTPLRSIVIHFSEKDNLKYLIEIVSHILAFDNKWWLFARYGSVSELGIFPCPQQTAAVEYEAEEKLHLAHYLCTRPIDLASSSADLYAIGLEGKILLTWDHHTASEGLNVDINSVTIASRMLSILNDSGAEMEVFYSNN